MKRKRDVKGDWGRSFEKRREKESKQTERDNVYTEKTLRKKKL